MNGDLVDRAWSRLPAVVVNTKVLIQGLRGEEPGILRVKGFWELGAFPSSFFSMQVSRIALVGVMNILG